MRFWPANAPPDRPPQIIRLEWTRPKLGGKRPWFICTCGTRCAILYVVGWLMMCRQCAGLRYASQSRSRRRRLYLKAQRLRRRLWDEGRPGVDELPPRHWRMHRVTYHRLRNQLEAIELELRRPRLYKPRERWNPRLRRRNLI